MADDELPDDDAELVDDLTEEIDPEDLEEDLVETDDEDEILVLDEDAVPDDAEEDADDRGPRVTTTPAGEDEDDDLEMVNEDDVEADLDTILKDRMTAADEEGEEDDEEAEVDDRGDPVDRIAPKRPDEFVCQSCFLLKTPNQLADAERMLCADCV
jgi:hypothetical protein